VADDDVVLRRSRAKSLLWLLACLGLIGGLVGYASHGGIGKILLAVVGLLLFGAGAILMGAQAVRPRDLVRLNRSGAWFHTGFGAPLALDWASITKVSVVQREHRVQTVALSVRDPEKAFANHHRAIKLQHNRWLSPLVKVLFGGVMVLAEGFDSASDIRELAHSDMQLHGTIEIPTTAGFPVSAKELARMLEERRRRYSGAVAR
jgi:hypothetical protein